MKITVIFGAANLNNYFTEKFADCVIVRVPELFADVVERLAKAGFETETDHIVILSADPNFSLYKAIQIQDIHRDVSFRYAAKIDRIITLDARGRAEPVDGQFNGQDIAEATPEERAEIAKAIGQALKGLVPQPSAVIKVNDI
jgi:hypothetical protein